MKTIQILIRGPFQDKTDQPIHYGAVNIPEDKTMDEAKKRIREAWEIFKSFNQRFGDNTKFIDFLVDMFDFSEEKTETIKLS